MNDELTDKTGARVRVTLNEDTQTYDVVLSDRGEVVGRAYFLDLPEGDRVFFHTEVVPSMEGRGLAGILVRQALADTTRHNLRVVPVCPVFAAHLRKHGEEFVRSGGRWRRPTQADLDAITDGETS